MVIGYGWWVYHVVRSERMILVQKSRRINRYVQDDSTEYCHCHSARSRLLSCDLETIEKCCHFPTLQGKGPRLDLEVGLFLFGLSSDCLKTWNEYSLLLSWNMIVNISTFSMLFIYSGFRKLSMLNRHDRWPTPTRYRLVVGSSLKGNGSWLFFWRFRELNIYFPSTWA